MDNTYFINAKERYCFPYINIYINRLDDDVLLSNAKDGIINDIPAITYILLCYFSLIFDAIDSWRKSEMKFHFFYRFDCLSFTHRYIDERFNYIILRSFCWRPLGLATSKLNKWIRNLEHGINKYFYSFICSSIHPSMHIHSINKCPFKYQVEQKNTWNERICKLHPPCQCRLLFRWFTTHMCLKTLMQ